MPRAQTKRRKTGKKRKQKKMWDREKRRKGEWEVQNRQKKIRLIMGVGNVMRMGNFRYYEWDRRKVQCTGWKATSKVFFTPPSSEIIYRFKMCNSNLTPRHRQSDVNLTINLQRGKLFERAFAEISLNTNNAKSTGCWKRVEGFFYFVRDMMIMSSSLSPLLRKRKHFRQFR